LLLVLVTDQNAPVGVPPVCGDVVTAIIIGIGVAGAGRGVSAVTRPLPPASTVAIAVAGRGTTVTIGRRTSLDPASTGQGAAINAV